MAQLEKRKGRVIMAEMQQQLPTPFLLTDGGTPSLPALGRKMLLKGVEALSGLGRCQRLYERVAADCPAAEFARRALELLQVDCELDPRMQSRIPANGACVLIANHPFGGVEGLVLLDLLARIRPDFKLMANHLLARIPQLRERLICVDPFDGDSAARTNIAPLRQSLNWLAEGGLLVIFPAGEVSSWQADRREVSDPPWSATLARIVRRSKAPVLPVYFPGENGALFQWAGRIHPRLRTLLLPRMLLNKRGCRIAPHVGQPIPARRLAQFDSGRELNDYLRLRTYALGLKAEAGSAGHSPQQSGAPLIEALPRRSLCAEVATLRRHSLLLASGEFEVLLAEGEEAPHLLTEIGRLREQTFRQVGEGTGRSVDLDRFDADYSHLMVWNRERRELVGAYRIGRVDRLLAARGRGGLYTSTLFDFKPQLLRHLHGALELGRSFVHPAYQRSFAPLLLLWKGIGAYLVRNPQYRYLFGSVSISGDYRPASRRLMTSTLAHHYRLDDLAPLVAARLPVTLAPPRIAGCTDPGSRQLLHDMEEVSALVADLEADGKGIPVLLRHYLGLGGRFLAFNLDPAFGGVIDGLVLVDLQQAPAKQLRRYLGFEGYAAYQRYWQSHAHQSQRCG